jgi:hypothetical protein
MLNNLIGTLMFIDVKNIKHLNINNKEVSPVC